MKAPDSCAKAKESNFAAKEELRAVSTAFRQKECNAANSARTPDEPLYCRPAALADLQAISAIMLVWVFVARVPPGKTMSICGPHRAAGVRVHNLKSIDLDIPHRKLIVFCGLSGSGKSSLALDTLYAEGQRPLYRELSAYTRQFLQRLEKPEAERIDGIPPAIAVTGRTAADRAARPSAPPPRPTTICGSCLPNWSHVLSQVRPRGALRKSAKRRRNPRAASAGHAVHDRLFLFHAQGRHCGNNWRPDCVRTVLSARSSTVGWSV